ncbi:MAG: aminoacyl-tRNA hydrolase [Trueperaceae bacterium]
MKLIVGLGNPGARYAGTRHNAGFLVLDELARRWGASFRSGRQADAAGASGVVLLKPRTFMNLSGAAVQAEMARGRIPPGDLLVVHDDLDLPLGRLRLRRGGGAGGQRGVQDVIARIGPDFDRLKVGVSRPPEGWTAEHWVLSRFRDDEAELLDRVVRHAADAIERVRDEGWAKAVTWTNRLDLAAPPPSPPAA